MELNSQFYLNSMYFILIFININAFNKSEGGNIRWNFLNLKLKNIDDNVKIMYLKKPQSDFTKVNKSILSEYFTENNENVHILIETSTSKLLKCQNALKITKKFQVNQTQHKLTINNTLSPNRNLTKYSKSQVWKIHLTDTRHFAITKLKKFYGGEIWDMNTDGIDMFFNKIHVYGAKVYIDTTNVTYNIMIEDVEAVIKDTYKIANLTKGTVPWLTSDDLRMTWDRYQDIEVFNEFLHYVIEKFPLITQLITIGRSNEKRDINVLKITNGNIGNPVVFIDAGMQAREWIGPAALTLAISKLLFNYKFKSRYIKNIDWYFVPILNPDGYEFSRKKDRLWTKNRKKNHFCAGVNIDRNFNYEWGKKGSRGDPCSTYFRGSERFSEPEAVALRNILLRLGQQIKAYISIGSYGQMITYPWGDDDFVPNTYQQMHSLGNKIVKAIRKSTGGEYQIGSSYGLKFARAGNSADWVMATITPNIVFNIYLRDQGRYGFLLPPNFIIQSGFDVYEIMKSTAQNIENFL